VLSNLGHPGGFMGHFYVIKEEIVKQWNSWFTPQFISVVFACILVLTLISCGGDGGNSSPFGSVSGNYAGTIQDSVAGAGTVKGTLSESGSSLSGTFQATSANQQQFLSGTVSGTINGTSITLTFTPSVPTSCPANITLNQVSATQLTGTYAAFNCTQADSGTINVTRQ